MENNKVLFLDVDGVLNSRLSRKDSVLSPEMIHRLATIIRLTGCCIVVSSSWRIGIINTPDADFWKRIEEFGSVDDAELIISSVIGVTPNFEDAVKWDEDDNVLEARFGVCREDEIKVWLEVNEHLHWVALDDLDMDLPDTNFVRTDFETGLTEEKMNEVVQKFGG